VVAVVFRMMLAFGIAAYGLVGKHFGWWGAYG
jgi:hypothetical protein